MRRANEADRSVILEYLKNGLQDCVYLYIDILNYGISSENMTVWVDECEDGISLVVMKYFDSFQVYSHALSRDMASVAELLKVYPVAMVSGRKDLIQELAALCPGYRASYGGVFLLDSYRKLRGKSMVELAAEADAEEIARLICSDKDLGGHYTVEGLASQLRERIRTGTGRSYIIRKDGQIVAHSATYAEADDVAVLSGSIVKEKYRNTFYFWVVSSQLVEQLMAEGKTVYAFAIEENALRYHEQMCPKCGEYGKLVPIGNGL